MSDKWKDVGPGGNAAEQIADAFTGKVLGDKRTVQNTETGEYREVYRGHDQSTGEAVSKGQFTDKDSSTWNTNDSGGSSGGSDNSGSSGSFCFLTTACVTAMGLPDDCTDLVTLRRFRDEYVKALPSGIAEIRSYYDLAPRILEAINQRTDRLDWYRWIYQTIVSPCVGLIANGYLDEAFSLYKQQTQQLSAAVMA